MRVCLIFGMCCGCILLLCVCVFVCMCLIACDECMFADVCTCMCVYSMFKMDACLQVCVYVI